MEGLVELSVVLTTPLNSRDYEFMKMQEAYHKGAELSELEEIFFFAGVAVRDAY